MQHGGVQKRVSGPSRGVDRRERVRVGERIGLGNSSLGYQGRICTVDGIGEDNPTDQESERRRVTAAKSEIGLRSVSAVDDETSALRPVLAANEKQILYTVNLQHLALYQDTEYEILGVFPTLAEANDFAGRYLHENVHDEWDEYESVMDAEGRLCVTAEGEGESFVVDVCREPYDAPFGSIFTDSSTKAKHRGAPDTEEVYTVIRLISGDGTHKDEEGDFTLLGNYTTLEEAQIALPKLLIKDREDHDGWSEYNITCDSHGRLRISARTKSGDKYEIRIKKQQLPD